MEYVKVCGLKKMEDIKLCIEEGANAIGFIYNVPESPRNLEKSVLLDLLKKVPKNIKSVITFRASSAVEVEKIMNEIDADLFQIHCNFNIRDFDRFPSVTKKKMIIALKTNQVNKGDVIKMINQSFDQFFSFLIDNSEGSGTEIDHELVLEIRRRTAGSKIIIAGGINIDNIEFLIKNLEPYGIDASSSLESKKGVKDPIKIKLFLKKIKEVKKRIVRDKYEI